MLYGFLGTFKIAIVVSFKPMWFARFETNSADFDFSSAASINLGEFSSNQISF